jgi:hypothetical protein
MGFVGRYRGYRPVYMWVIVTGGLCGLLAGGGVGLLVRGLIGRSAAELVATAITGASFAATDIAWGTRARRK